MPAPELRPSTPGTGASAPAPTSNELRVFTYEDDATIDLLKAQIKIFDGQAGTVTTVDSLPGSGAAVYPGQARDRVAGRQRPRRLADLGRPDRCPVREGQAGHGPQPLLHEVRLGLPKINEAAVAGMTFDGVKAGVPFISLGIGGWYNKAAFEKAGVDGPPTSYAELEEANDKLLASGITPLATAGKYGWHIMRLYEYLLEHTAGPDLHDKLLIGEESWDRPEVVDSFTLFKKWQDKKWIPDGALGLDPADVEPWYVQGKAAYTITGPWTEANAIQSAKKDSADFGNFEFPTDQSTARHSGFVEGYMINAKSGNPDKSAELIDFLVKPETQKALKITASTVAGAEPDQKELPLSYEWSQGPGKNPFYTIQDQAFPKQQADQYFSIQSDILQGKITPAEAAKQMQDVVSAWAKK